MKRGPQRDRAGARHADISYGAGGKGKAAPEQKGRVGGLGGRAYEASSRGLRARWGPVEPAECGKKGNSSAPSSPHLGMGAVGTALRRRALGWRAGGERNICACAWGRQPGSGNGRGLAGACKIAGEQEQRSTNRLHSLCISGQTHSNEHGPGTGPSQGPCPAAPGRQRQNSGAGGWQRRRWQHAAAAQHAGCAAGGTRQVGPKNEQRVGRWAPHWEVSEESRASGKRKCGGGGLRDAERQLQ